MYSEELRDAPKQQPFEPFRLVMTDGQGFDIRHPDLLLVGRRSATVKVDLRHVFRWEPLEALRNPPSNGSW